MKTSSLPDGQIILEIKTSEGAFYACYSDKGLARVYFPDGTRTEAYPELAELVVANKGVKSILPEMRQWHKSTTTAIQNILRGRDAGKLPPLDLSDGTDFQREVWQALIDIPMGKTKTYQEVADAVGRPKATRAVGGACGANPIPLLVPCHRVLAAGGKIGGFSSGLPWKRKLLAVELGERQLFL